MFPLRICGRSCPASQWSIYKSGYFNQERHQPHDRTSGMLDAMETSRKQLDFMEKELDILDKCQKIAAAIMRDEDKNGSARASGGDGRKVSSVSASKASAGGGEASTAAE